MGRRNIPALDDLYVTETATKHHRAGCRYLSHSSMEDAKTAGYEPCSVCKPPE